MKIILLLLISIVPVIILGYYIYRKDRNKEPIRLLFKLFIGGLIAILITFVTTSMLSFFLPSFVKIMNATSDNFLLIFLKAFVGVALIEELSKWFITYIIVSSSPENDEIFDSIIYATFVALGFAFFENTLYLFNTYMSDGIHKGIFLGILRAVLAIPGHTCYGIFMGYYLGLAKEVETKNKKQEKYEYLFLSIIVPIILHGIYDFCLFIEKTPFLIAFLIFIILMYFIAIKKIKHMSKNNRKIKFEDAFCSRCGRSVDSEVCPNCGNINK